LITGNGNAVRRANVVTSTTPDAFVIVDPDRTDVIPLVGFLQLTVSSVFVDLDAFNHLDAILWGDLYAGAAVYTVIDINIVI